MPAPGSVDTPAVGLPARLVAFLVGFWSSLPVPARGLGTVLPAPGVGFFFTVFVPELGHPMRSGTNAAAMSDFLIIRSE